MTQPQCVTSVLVRLCAIGAPFAHLDLSRAYPSAKVPPTQAHLSAFAEGVWPWWSGSCVLIVKPRDRNAHERYPPLTLLCFGSLDSNQLCGLDKYGRGTYTAEGISKIAEMLQLNKTLTSVRCPKCLLLSQKRHPPLTLLHSCPQLGR